jgi:hypothetical protein
MKKNFFVGIVLLSLLSVAAAPMKPAEQDSSLSISPSSAGQTDLPNTVVTYSLQVTNNSGAKQTISVASAAGAAGWNTWVDPASFDLEDKASANVTVSVVIKAGAALGDFDTTTVTASDGAGHSATATLTTRAAPPTATPLPTATSTPQPTIPPALNRPMIIVGGYGAGGDVGAGDEFDLDVTFINNGRTPAQNLVFTFSSDVFMMRNTGGVRTLSSLANGATAHVVQPMTAGATLAASAGGSVIIKVTYTDSSGENYEGDFTLMVNTKGATSTPTYAYGSWSTSTPTQTARSQLVVTSYQASVDPLQPGTDFYLEMEVHNTGNADAHAVSMVLGGGAAADSSSGTPIPGSASGGSSDLTNFAPLGTSNLLSLGDIPQGATIKVKTRLIVNVSTVPGAYPLKLSFVYSDAKNNQQVDNQVITLLVYSLPQVDVTFYRDPGMLAVGQPNPLPIQVTNLGRKSVVLGSMKVTSDQAEVTNNVIQVGSIDAGGYFPLDAIAIPKAAGPITLTVTINYSDDFNQMRTIIKTIETIAQEGAPEMMGTPEPGQTGMTGKPGAGQLESQPPVEETFWDKALRFVKGLVGLDSASPQTIQSPVPVITPDTGPTLSGGKG